MPDLGPEVLSDKRQLVLILRLVTAPTGRLLHGEVIDVDGGPSEQFVGWRGVTPAVRAWLTRELGQGYQASPTRRLVERHLRPVKD